MWQGGEVMNARILWAVFSWLLVTFVVTGPAKLEADAAPLFRQNGKIAFASDRDGNAEIYVMNPDGTDQVRLTKNSLSDSWPAWSPNGRSIAFVCQRHSGDFAICLMDGDGANRREITALGDSDFGGQISWSPEGSRLAFEVVSSTSANSDIHVVEIDGSNRRNLTSDNPSWDGGGSWSPDGSRILFSRYLPGNIGPILHTIRPDGTGLQALPNGFADGFGDFDPKWSPAGDKIVFVVNVWDFYSVIYTANADGTNRRFLTGCWNPSQCPDDSDRFLPNWSPDGTKIVFNVADRFWTTWDIHVVDIDGTNLKSLTSSQGRNTNPSWQPVEANISIAGRVMTPSGVGLRNAIVSLIDSSGVRRTATTSSLGFYSFSDVQADKIITITVSSRRYRFQPITREVNESLSNVDLVGIE